MKLAIALALAGLSSAAPAAVVNDKQAQAVIQGCVAHAKQKGQKQAIAVVDPGGQTVAALRMDGNTFGALDLAIEKARAVSAWGAPTAELAKWLKTTPGFEHAPHVVIVPGGLPIYTADDERIGAVGVSGEEPPDDVACGLSGIAAAKLKAAPR